MSKQASAEVSAAKYDPQTLEALRTLCMCPDCPALVLIDHSLLRNQKPSEVAAIVASLERESIRPYAVCVYSDAISSAKQYIQTIKLATVVNFPYGADPLSDVVKETKKALEKGAEEIDMVINYKAIIRNEKYGLLEATRLVAAVKPVCVEHNAVLKVIIESGELKSDNLIIGATMAAIKGGADFVKTSTGKVPVNATPESCKLIMNCIAAYSHIEPDRCIGFKPAGGVSNIAEFVEVVKNAETIFGKGWLNSSRFRLGSSRLLSQVMEALG